MTELLLAVLIVTLAAGGLGLGLAFGRGSAKTSCGAAACLPDGPCETCPRRRMAAREGHQ